MANRWGEKWKQWQTLFYWAPKSLQTMTTVMKLHLLLGRKTMTNVDSILKKQRHHFANKIHAVSFSSSHVRMWELDHKEGWTLKNLCFQTVVLEKTPESPLGSKEIRPVSPKGNWPWIFIGRTDDEAEAPNLWPPDMKRLIRKDLNAGKDWGQEEKGAMEDEMTVWHHRLNGYEFEQTPGDSERQGSLECYSLWGHKESKPAEWLNNNSILSPKPYSKKKKKK